MPDMKNRPGMNLTFSQQYGYKPLPEPMRLGHLSADLQRDVWNAFRQMLNKHMHYGVDSAYFDVEGKRFVEKVLGKFYGVPEDQIRTDCRNVFARFKEISLDGEFYELIDLIVFVVNDKGADIVDQFKNLFEEHAAPYWFDTTFGSVRVVPRSSAEEGKAVQYALDTMFDARLDDAVLRLRNASENINARKYGPSIDDSVSAVEFVATKFDPKGNKKLGAALDSLVQIGMLKDEHITLKDAFKKLYGYASAIVEGRHGVSAKNAPVAGLEEAMFIYGACASFSAYLVNKHRQMQSKDSESA